MSRGLGRGFESLIPTDLLDEEFDPTAEETSKVSKLVELEVEKIFPDEEQPRRDFDEEALGALADSISEHGVLQPIVVVKVEKGYKIVAGERRWRATKIAGVTKIPAIVRTLDAQNQLELSVIENAQREDLNAIELATAYLKLKNQFNLSEEEIAKRVGKSKASVVNTMRLLNLPESAKKAMVEHKLSEGLMRPLITMKEEDIEAVVPRIVEEGWTTRRVEQYAAAHKQKSSTKAVKENTFVKQEEKLAKKYSAKVKIKARTVTFSCKNEKELQKLIERL